MSEITAEEIVGRKFLELADEMVRTKKKNAELEGKIFSSELQIGHIGICSRCGRGPKILPWKDDDNNTVCPTCTYDLGKLKAEEKADVELIARVMDLPTKEQLSIITLQTIARKMQELVLDHSLHIVGGTAECGRQYINIILDEVMSLPHFMQTVEKDDDETF